MNGREGDDVMKRCSSLSVTIVLFVRVKVCVQYTCTRRTNDEYHSIIPVEGCTGTAQTGWMRPHDFFYWGGFFSCFLGDRRRRSGARILRKVI